MPNTYVIDVPSLAAVAIAMSKEPTRYNLCGVLLSGDQAVATDGHRLHVVDKAIKDEAGKHPTQQKLDGIIVPSGTVDQIVKLAKGQGVTQVTVVVGKRGKTGLDVDLAFTVGGISLSVRSVDGQYPDFNSIKPRGNPSPMAVIAFNPSYVLDCHKALKRLGLESNDSAQLEFFGDTLPIKVYHPLVANFVAWVMPMKTLAAACANVVTRLHDGS